MTEKIKVSMGNDHAGYRLKNLIKQHLVDSGYEVIDRGTGDEQSVDYPDFALPVCKDVLEAGAFGILVCGTGIGMSMAANKVRGIRAALCTDDFTASVTREHNDANVLCLGARTTDEKTAIQIAEIFLTTEFAGGRHSLRVNKIMDLEKISF